MPVTLRNQANIERGLEPQPLQVFRGHVGEIDREGEKVGRL
jgi:hypothetical protein